MTFLVSNNDKYYSEAIENIEFQSFDNKFIFLTVNSYNPEIIMMKKTIKRTYGPPKRIVYEIIKKIPLIQHTRVKERSLTLKRYFGHEITPFKLGDNKYSYDTYYSLRIRGNFLSVIYNNGNEKYKWIIHIKNSNMHLRAFVRK
jgi:hypothetical protein